jgi:hypothetical protein
VIPSADAEAVAATTRAMFRLNCSKGTRYVALRRRAHSAPHRRRYSNDFALYRR